jgi:hypothetical protein
MRLNALNDEYAAGSDFFQNFFTADSANEYEFSEAESRSALRRQNLSTQLFSIRVYSRLFALKSLFSTVAEIFLKDFRAPSVMLLHTKWKGSL